MQLIIQPGVDGRSEVILDRFIGGRSPGVDCDELLKEEEKTRKNAMKKFVQTEV